MRKCPSCATGRLQTAHTELSYRLGELTYSVQVPVLRCGACGDESVADADLARTELEVAVRAMRDANGAGITFARKALGLRATELAQLLDLRPETISRWEHGTLRPAPIWFALLAALATERLEGRDTLSRELRAQADRQGLPLQ